MTALTPHGLSPPPALPPLAVPPQVGGRFVAAQPAASPLAGWRILVVEDETLLAIVMEEALTDLACTVIGPAGKLEVALRLATTEALDAAVMDVNIRGEAVYPVADLLRARGIPFVLATGYGDWALPDAFRQQPRLDKPFTLNALAECLLALRRPG